MFVASPPAAVTVSNETGRSAVVLICEHASNWIPPDYAGLGLQTADLMRHIAWDIGALAVALRLSAHLDAPLVAAGASRLMIDLNRPTDSDASIPEISEATLIPGNLNLSPAERQRRVGTWFDPFHARLSRLLDERSRANQPSIIVAIHSFTPVFLGQVRSMRAGVLYRRSQRFGADLVAALDGLAGGIAHNAPYQIEDASDYTIPVHGEARGLEAVLVEIRQDLLETPTNSEYWANILAESLRKSLVLTDS